MLLRAFAAVPSLDVLCQFHRRCLWLRFRLLHPDMDDAVEPVALIGDFAASSDEVYLVSAFHLPGGLIPYRFCVCNLTVLILLQELGNLIFIRQAMGLSYRRDRVSRHAGYFRFDGYFPETLPDIRLREHRPCMAQAKKTDEGKKDFPDRFISRFHSDFIRSVVIFCDDIQEQGKRQYKLDAHYLFKFCGKSALTYQKTFPYTPTLKSKFKKT
jgi:hypothetical protein